MIGHEAFSPSFYDLAAYLESGHDGIEVGRVAWVQPFNIWAPTLHDAATVMALLASASPTGSPVYHLSVSFDPSDRTDRALMLLVAGRLLHDLELPEYQAVAVAHNDRDHAHFHLMVNRVHPRTGRLWKLDFSKQAVERSLRLQERELGLRENPGHLYRLPGQLRPSRDVSLGAGVLRREDRTGIPPYIQVARAEISSAFVEATSFSDLEHRLAIRGHRLEERSRGLIVTNGAGYASVSTVSATASRPKLEARFGETFAEYRRRTTQWNTLAGGGDSTFAGPRDGGALTAPSGSSASASRADSVLRVTASDPAVPGGAGTGAGGAGSGAGGAATGAPAAEGISRPAGERSPGAGGGERAGRGAGDGPLLRRVRSQDGGSGEALDRGESGGGGAGEADGDGARLGRGDDGRDNEAAPGDNQARSRNARGGDGEGRDDAGDDAHPGERGRQWTDQTGRGDAGRGAEGTQPAREAPVDHGQHPLHRNHRPDNAGSTGVDHERGAAQSEPSRRGRDLLVQLGERSGSDGDAASYEVAVPGNTGLRRGASDPEPAVAPGETRYSLYESGDVYAVQDSVGPQLFFAESRERAAVEVARANKIVALYPDTVSMGHLREMDAAWRTARGLPLLPEPAGRRVTVPDTTGIPSPPNAVPRVGDSAVVVTGERNPVADTLEAATAVAARRSLRDSLDAARLDVHRTNQVAAAISAAALAAAEPLADFRAALCTLYGERSADSAEETFRRIAVEESPARAVEVLLEDPRTLVSPPPRLLAGGADARARAVETGERAAVKLAALDRAIAVAALHAGLAQPAHRGEGTEVRAHLLKSLPQREALLSAVAAEYRLRSSAPASAQRLRRMWAALDQRQQDLVRSACPGIDQLVQRRTRTVESRGI